MTLVQSFLLGLLQGLTEFLPISSSGHLVLAEHFLGLTISPTILQHFDIILHAGTLIALLLYFRRTWWAIARHPLRKQDDGGPSLLLLLIVATIPAGIVGVFGGDWIEEHTRFPLFTAGEFLATGTVLLIGEFLESRSKRASGLGWRQIIAMSIGQAIAVLPGCSRSGFTLSAGRMTGLRSDRATEVTFLMGGPALGGAVLYTLMKGMPALSTIGIPQVLIGLTTALVVSLLVMHIFLLSIRRYGTWMWSLYLFIAGLLLIGHELAPALTAVMRAAKDIPVGAVLPVIFFATLLEAIPFTSTLMPGTTVIFASATILRGHPVLLTMSILLGTIAAIAGHCMGYFPARQAIAHGHWKEKGEARLERAQRFFARWGFWAVIVGSWYGPLRLFVSIAAGIGGMPVRKYLIAVAIGSAIWMTTIILSATLLSEIVGAWI